MYEAPKRCRQGKKVKYLTILVLIKEIIEQILPWTTVRQANHERDRVWKVYYRRNFKNKQ